MRWRWSLLIIALASIVVPVIAAWIENKRRWHGWALLAAFEALVMFVVFGTDL